MRGPSLAGVLCAHPLGCALADGAPRPARARWKGVPYCAVHYARARKNDGDPGGPGLLVRACDPAPCCVCGGQFYRPYKGNTFCATHFSRVSKDGAPGPARRLREPGEPCARCGGAFRRRVSGEPLCEKCSIRVRYEDNRAAELDRNKKYRHAHRVQLAEATRERFELWRSDPANVLKERATRSAWRARRRDLRREQNQRRSRRSAGGTVTAGWLAVLLTDPCAYCGDDAIGIDHIVPLFAGGEHDWSNVVGACQRCNSQKRATSLLRFLLQRD